MNSKASRDSNLAFFSDPYTIACMGLLAPSGLAVQAYCMPELIQSPLHRKLQGSISRWIPVLSRLLSFSPKPTSSSLLLTLKFTTNHADSYAFVTIYYT